MELHMNILRFCVRPFIMAVFTFTAMQENELKAQHTRVFAADTFSQKETEAGCGGSERWQVKTLSDTGAKHISFSPLSTNLRYLVSLSTPFPNPVMSRVSGLEDKTYSVTCWIIAKKLETDNDYHLILSDGQNTLIAEIPDPSCPSAASSGYASWFTQARNFIDVHLPSGDLTNIFFGPVTVTGIAFIDPPHNQTGAAPNNLELHPVIQVSYPVSGLPGNSTPLCKVSLKPNPLVKNTSISFFQIWGEQKELWLDLYSMLGTKISSTRFPPLAEGETSLNLEREGLSEGIYFCRILSDGIPIWEGKLVIK